MRIVITAVVPKNGPLAGGNLVTLIGASLSNGTDVKLVRLAGITASIVTQTSASIVVTAGPSGAPVGGSVMVQSASYGWLNASGLSYNYTLGTLQYKLTMQGEGDFLFTRAPR